MEWKFVFFLANAKWFNCRVRSRGEKPLARRMARRFPSPAGSRRKTHQAGHSAQAGRRGLLANFFCLCRTRNGVHSSLEVLEIFIYYLHFKDTWGSFKTDLVSQIGQACRVLLQLQFAVFWRYIGDGPLLLSSYNNKSICFLTTHWSTVRLTTCVHNSNTKYQRFFC